MKFHVAQFVTLTLLAAAFGWMVQPAPAETLPVPVETWSAIVEIDGMADRIDYNMSLADCMERLGEYEKSFPVVEVTYCEREFY